MERSHSLTFAKHLAVKSNYVGIFLTLLKNIFEIDKT